MTAHSEGVSRAQLNLDVMGDVAPAGWVLLVAPPEAFHDPLCEALERRGFGVVIRSSLGEVLDATQDGPPRCFICDTDLANGWGFEIARALRAHEDLGYAPLVCLTADEDRRLGALETIADAALSKDAPAEQAAVQIDALVRFADRIGDGAADAAPPRRAFAGDLGLVSLQTLLGVLALERRSGTLEVSSGKVRAELHLVDGCAVMACLAGQPTPALAALRAMLALRGGRFSFSAESVHGASADAADLRELTIEALRLADEANQAATESRRRLRPVRSAAPRKQRVRATA